MSLQRATCLAMGIDPVGLAGWLRQRLDGGDAPEEILRQAKDLDMHPLSIALCREGWPTKSLDLRQANRRVARLLGIGDPWISQIQADGLRIRDSQIKEVPDGLVLPRLDLSRLKSLVAIPARTYVHRLRIHQCHKLVRLPSLRGLRQVEVYDSHAFRDLPGDLDLDRLEISACLALETLPALRTEYLSVSSCPILRRLPSDLWCRHLVLARLPLLEGPLPTEGLPEGAKARILACPGIIGKENP